MAPTQPIRNLQRFTVSAQPAGRMDLCALELGYDAKVAADSDFTFFNAPGADTDAVRLRGADLTVDCALLRRGVLCVLMAASAAAATMFASLPDSDRVTLRRVGADELGEWSPARDFDAGAVVFACAHRDLGGWTVTPQRRVFADLGDLAVSYGVQVDH